MARNPENFWYKVFALLCAIALHGYVASQTHPQHPKTIPLALGARNVPPGLLFAQNRSTAVYVTVEGPADDVDRLSNANLIAYVDARSAHAGLNPNLRVQVRKPDDMQDVSIVDRQPSLVDVVFIPKSHRTMRIDATFPATPPVGYAYRQSVISPMHAVVSGTREAVSSVATLVVHPATGTDTGAVDDDVPIVPLDSDGNQVTDVTIEPANAHVRIGVVKAPATKNVLVSPILVGSPPFPYKVADISVDPQSVIISGPVDRISRTSIVTTQPVDVSSATSDVVRSVAVIAPPGVALVGAPRVTVTVRIVTVQPEPTTPAAPIVPTSPQQRPAAP